MQMPNKIEMKTDYRVRGKHGGYSAVTVSEAGIGKCYKIDSKTLYRVGKYDGCRVVTVSRACNAIRDKIDPKTEYGVGKHDTIPGARNINWHNI